MSGRPYQPSPGQSGQNQNPGYPPQLQPGGYGGPQVPPRSPYNASPQPSYGQQPVNQQYGRPSPQPGGYQGQPYPQQPQQPYQQPYQPGGYQGQPPYQQSQGFFVRRTPCVAISTRPESRRLTFLCERLGRTATTGSIPTSGSVWRAAACACWPGADTGVQDRSAILHPGEQPAEFLPSEQPRPRQDCAACLDADRSGLSALAPAQGSRQRPGEARPLRHCSVYW